MKSNGTKKNVSSTTNGDKRKKDVQISKAIISDQFCIKMFDYMIF